MLIRTFSQAMATYNSHALSKIPTTKVASFKVTLALEVLWFEHGIYPVNWLFRPRGYRLDFICLPQINNFWISPAVILTNESCGIFIRIVYFLSLEFHCLDFLLSLAKFHLSSASQWSFRGVTSLAPSLSWVLVINFHKAFIDLNFQP